MLSIKQICAMVGENAVSFGAEIYKVKLADGSVFYVAGKFSAEEWVKKYGGEYYSTGKFELPTIG